MFNVRGQTLTGSTYVLGACVGKNLYRERGDEIRTELNPMHFAPWLSSLNWMEVAHDHNNDQVSFGLRVRAMCLAGNLHDSPTENNAT